MSEQKIIAPFSNEWVYVVFRLQLILGSPQVQLVSLRKRTSSFPEQYQSYLKIETAVDLTDMDLPSITSIKESLRKDLILKAGRVSVNLDNAHMRKYRMLLLKTVFSQTLPCLKEVSLSADDFLTNQPQFDAVYMSVRQQELSVFTHEYMMRDPKQYQWQYDAEFTFCEKKEWEQQKVVCANCKISTAMFYCKDDQEAYCAPCFGDLHRSERKSMHLKEAISPYNCPPHCQKGFHNNQPLTHYCFVCKQLKCSYCLADSDHKGSAESGHQSMESREFAVLFKETLVQKMNEAKAKIVSVIREVEGKIQLISGHYDLRVKEFARAFEQRVANMREWVEMELNVAAGFHSELKRKYDEVLWLETINTQLEQKSNAEMGMHVKEGISVYLNECFSREYFAKIEKKIQELKLFN